MADDAGGRSVVLFVIDHDMGQSGIIVKWIGAH